VALRLHSRLIVFNVTALGVMTLLLGYFLSTNLKTTFEFEIESQLHRSALLASSYIRANPGRADAPELASEVSKLLGVRVTVITPDGRVLADSDVARGELPALESHSDVGLSPRRGRRGVHTEATGIRFIYVATRLDDRTVVRLTVPRDRRYDGACGGNWHWHGSRTLIWVHGLRRRLATSENWPKRRILAMAI
jgi:hypothetical protein